MYIPKFYTIKHISGKYIARCKITRNFKMIDITEADIIRDTDDPDRTLTFLWDTKVVTNTMMKAILLIQYVDMVKITRNDIVIETLTVGFNKPLEKQKPLVHTDKNGEKVYQYFKDNGIENVLHHEDGPAFIVLDPNNLLVERGYYINGKLHCEDGPAFIRFNKNSVHMSCEEWYINGEMHNENGYAKIIYDSVGKNSIGRYCLHDKEVSKEYFKVYQLNKIIKPYDLEIRIEPQYAGSLGQYNLQSIMPGLDSDQMRAGSSYYHKFEDLHNAILGYIE